MVRWLVFSLLFSFSLQAEQTNGAKWIKKMQQAVKKLNYEMSFVVVSGNKATPWRWFHGLVDDKEIEILTALNGPGQQMIRVGDVVTYLQPEEAAFSIKGAIADSPLPEVLSADPKVIQASYDLHVVGKSRVAGLPARLIRILSRQDDRYHYWIWVHEETGLMLKSAVVSNEGEVLEQIQVSNLQVTEESNVLINEVAEADLPEPYSVKKRKTMADLDWQIHWVPKGFSPVKLDRHYLLGGREIVDYMMLSDGIVWCSIYMRPLNQQESIQPMMLNSGAITYLSLPMRQHEVTLVGKIPPQTAERLLNSIRWK
ncbi:MucB/RseB C-terminal domain-containing protein [Gayadomonas joobiniege]|uniref:MucB/RseB C-terminal domain-containing protein n=1 Tax=Gayadomonas joobiniege TaxID=1234606 RepID=UPI003B42F586